jgi:hypothetical protein
MTCFTESNFIFYLSLVTETNFLEITCSNKFNLHKNFTIDLNSVQINWIFGLHFTNMKPTLATELCSVKIKPPLPFLTTRQHQALPHLLSSVITSALAPFFFLHNVVFFSVLILILFPKRPTSFSVHFLSFMSIVAPSLGTCNFYPTPVKYRKRIIKFLI